jgi:hypothetical protein
MASSLLPNPGTVVVRGQCQEIPLTFRVSDDGHCPVTAARLASRFQLLESSLYVDEEVYDMESGLLTHTIGHDAITVDGRKSWLLKCGAYRVYGVRIVSNNPSARALGGHLSSGSNHHSCPSRKVKVEPGSESIHVLSDDSDSDIPLPTPVVKQMPTPSTINLHSLDCQSSDGKPASPATPPLPPYTASPGCIVDCIKKLAARKGSKSILSRVDFSTVRIFAVNCLPPSFDGTAVYVLPASSTSSSRSQAKLLEGMDKRHDGHAWTRTVTTHILNEMGLSFRMSSCLGHLICSNDQCNYRSRVHRPTPSNETEWDGTSYVPFDVDSSPPMKSTVVCKVCKTPPSCLNVCSSRIYYILGPPAMSRACVHIGSHKHPVKIGADREAQEQFTTLLNDEVERTPTATNSAIVLEAGKEFVGELLLNPEGMPAQCLSMEELVPVLDKCKNLTSPNLRNKVASFRNLRRYGVLDSITKLRGSSKWAYLQNNMFPGQGSQSDKVFVFKMSEVGPGSGVDLVRRMQSGGDLSNAWLMFDHVKRVKGWTTMACHVYDASYCRVMTIAVCDMQSEDVEAQLVFWRNLNVVTARHGILEPQFKGFMADSAQANWNAVRIMYGSGDPKTPMKDRERTCLFHWTQSLEKHTKADIRPDLQAQHRLLCKQYKNAKSLEEAEMKYLAIRSWWLSSGATTNEGLVRLDLWLAFWHFRYRQWGGFMELVSNSSHSCVLHFLVPILNVIQQFMFELTILF